MNFVTGVLRVCFLTSSESSCGSDDHEKTKRMIGDLTNKIAESNLTDASHPLLLPSLFLQHHLQLLEHSYFDGFTAATYQDYQFLSNLITKSSSWETLQDMQADIGTTASMIFDTHQRLSRRKLELSNLKLMLGNLLKGVELLGKHGKDSDIDQSFDCLGRLEFFKERIAVLEAEFKMNADEVAAVDTMVSCINPIH